MESFTSGKSETELSTGTTTVAVVTDDGVLLAADRRASLGGRFVANKGMTKIEQVHPTAAITIAGSVGGAQGYARQLQAQASLYETRRGKRMSIPALAQHAGDMLRGLPVSILLGGADEDGGHLYQVDAAGGVIEETQYAASGSGMQLAYGTLENDYEEGLSLDDAREAAIDAITAASERDTASGNGIMTATITTDGVEITEEE